MTQFLRVCIIAVVFSGLVSGSQSKNNYNVEKTSPNGVYRVKVEAHVTEEGDIFSHFSEQGKIQVFKGSEIIYADEWKRRDNWEPTFKDTFSVIEWVNANALRMGRDSSKELVKDEMIIWNRTNEPLRHIGVSCSKYEHFDVFDIAADSRMVLHISPGLNLDASGHYWLGYGGETQSGKKFTGVLKQTQPNRSLRLEIAVRARDLKSARG